MTSPARLSRRTFLGGLVSAPVAAVLPGPAHGTYFVGIDAGGAEQTVVSVVDQWGRLVGTWPPPARGGLPEARALFDTLPPAEQAAATNSAAATLQGWRDARRRVTPSLRRYLADKPWAFTRLHAEAASDARPDAPQPPPADRENATEQPGRAGP